MGCDIFRTFEPMLSLLCFVFGTSLASHNYLTVGMLHCAGRAALEKLKHITADEAASISHGSQTQTEGENKVTGLDELFI